MSCSKLPFRRLFISSFFLFICLFHKFVAFVVVFRNGFSGYVVAELIRNQYLIDDSSNDLSDASMANYEANDEDSRTSGADTKIGALIRFTPSSLKFSKHSVGIPYIERVLIENLQDEGSINMHSISGNTVHFHCSFFEDKLIHARGNTSFDVVFLARKEGRVGNTLYIHTSIGSFKYKVSADGVSNPYRLRPFVGAKVPVNSSYSPVIHIYNPHASTLQLTEMYSTGGSLHLELPDGEVDASSDLWQIAPFETKPVMRANFLARNEKNHTAYIRIKTNSSDFETKEVILPIEVEVSAAPGIYSPVDLLDFGVMRATDRPKTLPIHVLNAGTKTVSIQNVIITPINEAMEIKFPLDDETFTPIKIAPNIFHAKEIASVTLNPAKISNSKQCTGKIVVKSKNNQYKLNIPYQVSLLYGYLDYKDTDSRFYIHTSSQSTVKAEKRNFHLTNHYNFTIIIHSVSLADEAKPYFKVVLISEPIFLQPNETKSCLKITFTPSKQLTQLQTHFRIHTNISYFDVELNAYSGKLEIFIPQSLNQTILDFKAIGLREKKSVIFAVINNNPVEVRLKHWGCNVSKAFVEFIGIEEGNATIIARKNNHSILKKVTDDILNIKPKHYALFKLHLTGFSEEGYFYGESHVDTEFETLKIPFLGRAIEGSLTSDVVDISNSFPGRISSQTVKVFSSFASELSVKSVQIQPTDETRFVFDQDMKSTIAFGENIVGKLYFDPNKGCGTTKTCYTGLDTSKEVGHLWLLGLALHPDTGYIDKELHKLLYSRWTNMQPYEKIINATVNFSTDSGHRVNVEARATLQWPRIVYGGKNNIRFPITRVGNVTLKEIMIENPSSQPLLAQVVLLSDYPNPDAAIQSLGSLSWWSEADLKKAETKPKSYRLLDTSGEGIHVTFGDKSKVKETFSVTPSKSSITLLLPVGYRTKVTVGFAPQLDPGMSSNDDIKASTFLLIRNNLTVLDAVYISGEGGSGLLKIGNQMPGLKSVLSFEFQEKHLKGCSGRKAPSSSVDDPNFTYQKSFSLVNYGKLPIRIKGFRIGPHPSDTSTLGSTIGPSSRSSKVAVNSLALSSPIGLNKLSSYLIGNKPCQGFGFRVLNCDPLDLDVSKLRKKEGGFVLRPNEKEKLVVTFTPDFTLEKAQAILTVVTDEDDFVSIDDFVQERNASEEANKASSTSYKPPVIQYSLVSTIPKDMLAICSKSLPRPIWENIFYYCIIILMVFTSVFSAIKAYYDASKILNFAFYPAIMMTRNANMDANASADASQASAYAAEKDKDGSRRIGSQLRQRKLAGGKSSTKNVPPVSVQKEKDANSSAILASTSQSWTSFLKQKFVRRDSSGSDKSNNSNTTRKKSGSVTNGNASAVTVKSIQETANNQKKNQSKEKLNEGRKKSAARGWFASLSSSQSTTNAKAPEPILPPTSPPSFPSAFDNDAVCDVGNKNKGGKNKTKIGGVESSKGLPSTTTMALSTQSSSQSISITQSPETSREQTNTLELPYKPKQTKSRKKLNQESKSDSFGEVWAPAGATDDNGTITNIWDSPITMFDTEKAMNELVKQTETFAEKMSMASVASAPDASVAAIPSARVSSLPVGSIQQSYSAATVRNSSPVVGRTFQQAIQRPSPASSPAWSLQDKKDAIERLSPSYKTLLDSQQPAASSSWITDNLLNNELNMLRETSSPWNTSRPDRLDSSFAATRPPPPGLYATGQSKLTEWTCLSGVDIAATTARSWEEKQEQKQQNSTRPPRFQNKWAQNQKSLPSNASSQPGLLWSEPTSQPKDAWTTNSASPSLSRSNATSSWTYSLDAPSSTTATSSTAQLSAATSSTFSLFGRSLWSPLSSTSDSSSNWSFSLFGSSAVGQPGESTADEKANK